MGAASDAVPAIADPPTTQVAAFAPSETGRSGDPAEREADAVAQALDSRWPEPPRAFARIDTRLQRFEAPGVEPPVLKPPVLKPPVAEPPPGELSLFEALAEVLGVSVEIMFFVLLLPFTLKDDRGPEPEPGGDKFFAARSIRRPSTATGKRAIETRLSSRSSSTGASLPKTSLLVTMGPGSDGIAE
jgi:hypothetical protein